MCSGYIPLRVNSRGVNKCDLMISYLIFWCKIRVVNYFNFLLLFLLQLNLQRVPISAELTRLFSKHPNILFSKCKIFIYTHQNFWKFELLINALISFAGM